MDYTPTTVDLFRAFGATLPSRDALACTVVEQQQALEKKSEVIASQQQRIALLEERVRLMQAQRFGRSSEQSDAQLALFDESPAPADEAPAKPDDKPKKRRTGRKGLSPELPRIPVYLRLSEDEKAGAVETFFVKVKAELDITPAKVQVL